MSQQGQDTPQVERQRDEPFAPQAGERDQDQSGRQMGQEQAPGMDDDQGMDEDQAI